MIQKVHINAGIVGRLNPSEVKALPQNLDIKDGTNINMPVMSLLPANWIKDLLAVYRKLKPAAAAACLEAVNAVPGPQKDLKDLLFEKPARFEDKGKMTWAIPTTSNELNDYAFEVGKTFCEVLYPMAKLAKLSHLLPAQQVAIDRIQKLTSDRCYYVSVANKSGDPWMSIGGLKRQEFLDQLDPKAATVLSGSTIPDVSDSFAPKSKSEEEMIEAVAMSDIGEVKAFSSSECYGLEDALKSHEDEIKWVAYHYTAGDYEGSGDMLVALTNGTFCMYGMSHCSCYGPMDNFAISGPFYTRDELAKLVDKDFNGKPIDPTEWNWEVTTGMWIATKAAVLYENRIQKQKEDLLVTVCQTPEIDLF